MRKVITAVLCVAVGAVGCGRPAEGPRRAEAGPASDQLTSALRPLRGKPVVVNYWATWCKPCKDEMPRLVKAADRYKRTVAFLGVNVEDDVDAAAEFARRNDIPFRSIADPDGEIRRDQEILGLPVTQFYDAAGELAFVHQGEISADELSDKIDDVLSLDEPTPR